MAIFGGKRSRLRRWVAASRPRVAAIERPTDFPQAHSDGADADRILLVGSGIVAGWGARSYADALPGALAASLSDLTTRGTDVDVIADPDLTIAGASAALRGAKVWRFDLVILDIGMADALAQTPPAHWRASMADLLAELDRSISPGARIVVLGIAPVGIVPAYTGPNAQIADDHAAVLDAVTAELCGPLPHATFLRLETDPHDVAGLAVEIGDAVVDALNVSRALSIGVARGASGQDAAERERQRLEAVNSSGLVDTPSEDRFDRIVTMARQLYGTSGAAFAVVDSEKVWHKSRSEGVPLAVPKAQSFCSTTILGRGPHVVADMLAGEDGTDPTAAAEVGMRFYAGYPVESPSGEQIGALCIFDPEPRPSSEFDETMLRQLALLIQAELQVDAVGGR